MSRTCDDCGIKMPPFTPRSKHPETGNLVCPGCHPDKPGGPGRPIGMHGSRKVAWDKNEWDEAHDEHDLDDDPCTRCGGDGELEGVECEACDGTGQTPQGRKSASLQVVAHDSGDGATIYHCPFCGAGQVTARSDGSVECGFCKNNFTVQVQPVHAAQPQTDPLTGQPLNMPGMPGDPAAHEAPVPAPAAEDPNFAPEGTGGDEGFAPAGTKGGQFLPAGTGNHIAASKTSALSDADATFLRGHALAYARGDEDYADWYMALPRVANANQQVDEVIRLNSKTSALYLTPDGVAIPEKSYLSHLALRFADDRDAVLSQVRSERKTR